MLEIMNLSSSSKGNCYYVSDGVSSLLLDPGIRYKDIQKAISFGVSELSAALLSHDHKDHSKAVSDLIKAGIDCYMSPGTAKILNLNSHRIHRVSALKQFAVGSWTILPFDVQHDAIEPIGFLLQSGKKKVLYATDTYYIKYKFSALSHIIIECNYSKELLNKNLESGLLPATHKNRVLKSHMALETVMEFLKANDLSKVEGIYLIHLSDQNSDAVMFKRYIQGLTGKPTYIAGEKGGWE